MGLLNKTCHCRSTLKIWVHYFLSMQHLSLSNQLIDRPTQTNNRLTHLSANESKNTLNDRNGKLKN